MEVIIAESKEYIYISVICSNEANLSWEELQKIKDRYYYSLDFIEVYPKKCEVINKANVRHLIHVRNWNCPKLKDLEVESLITKIQDYE